MTLDPTKLTLFLEKTTKSNRIAIISHMNADGDAMGSSLGLWHLLGQKPTLILPNGCPHQFEWMPGSANILSGDTQRERCEKALADSDLIIGVDFNTLNRVDFFSTALGQSKAYKFLIDHHHSPQIEAFDTVISVPELSSASELVYWIANGSYGDAAINQDAARCLYTGICTDTGSFSYSCEQPSLYQAAAALVSKDIDAAGIHNNIFNTYSVERMQFWGFALSERLKIFDHFAYFSISLEDQRRFGIGPADMEGLVNYTLMMEQVEVGALLREEEHRVKVSLRSKHDIDVNIIAREHFNGGGHTKASGGHTTITLEQTRQMLEDIFLPLTKM